MSSTGNREFSEEFQNRLAKYSSHEIQRGLILAQKLQDHFIDAYPIQSFNDQSNESADSLEIQSLLDQGIDNFQLGNNQVAIHNFSQILQINPNHIDSLCFRALSYGNVEDRDRAKKDLEKVLGISQIQEKSIHLLYAQAIGYSVLNNSVQTNQKFLEISYVLPDTKSRYGSIDWFLRGTVYYLCGNKEEALVNLVQSLKLNPRSIISLNLRSTIYFQMGNLESGIEDLSQALVIAPSGENSASTLHLRGLAYYDLANYERTIEDLTKALEINPQHKQSCISFYIRGLAYSQVGDLQKCSEDLTQSLIINRNHEKAVQSFYCRGVSYLSLGDFERAIDDLTEALKIDPKHENAALNFYYRGLANHTLADNQQAIEDLTKRQFKSEVQHL
jgi:tetratricopeptide (TPR) repeat protein